MTDEAKASVLQVAIEKAVEGGYVFSLKSAEKYGKYLSWINDNDYFKIIFSHDFARAFFGTARIITMNGRIMEAWQYQLQNMVLSKDPIEFLNDFLV